MITQGVRNGVIADPHRERGGSQRLPAPTERKEQTMSNPFENERAQPKEHFGSIQTFANALEQASNYGPSQPLPSEARPGRYRIALTQGLIFGVILAVTVFLLSHQLLVT